MVSLKSLFKAYLSSGALHSLVNAAGFIDDYTMLTKTGDVVSVLFFRGRDAECREPVQLDADAAAIASGLRVFGAEFLVNAYWLKRSVAPEIDAGAQGDRFVADLVRNRREYLAKGRLFSFETCLVVTRKTGWRLPGFGERFAAIVKNPKSAAAELFSMQPRMKTLNEPLEAAMADLRRSVNSFVEQTRDVLDARILDRAGCFRFLRRLLNPDRSKADAVRLKHSLHVDYFAADSELTCHRDALRLGNAYLKVLTLKEPPAHSFADIMRELTHVQAEAIIVTEWHPWETARAVAAIRAMRRHHHNTKIGLWSQIGPERPHERELLYDDSKEARVRDLGQCLEDIEMKGVQIGEFSLTVLLYGDTLEAVERAAAEVARAVGAHDGIVNEETYNGLNAFLAALPGGYPFNLRKLLVTNRNFVDFSLWFTPAEGERENAFLRAPCLAELETEERSLYRFNLHDSDVGHTVVLGPTGTGKSVWLNFIIAHAQQYRPYTWILDFGGSYRWLTEAIGGSCLTVRPGIVPFSINPFVLEPTPANRAFQFAFMKLLAESSGHRLTDVEEKDLFDATEAIQMLEKPHRRLGTIASTVGRGLGRHLKPWTQGGQYGAWFDHVEDNVSYARFQYIDIEDMKQIGPPLEPLLLYLFHRAAEIVAAPELATVFKLAVVDEAWLFFTHPVTRAYIVTALRTWRKRNAAMVLATQSLHDLPGIEIVRPVVANCPTKILFANPTLDADLYGEVLRLSPTEQDKVRGLTPKKQFLLKREGLSKVLNLNLDPKSYWLFTTNPYEAKRRAEAVAANGLESALDILAGGSR